MTNWVIALVSGVSSAFLTYLFGRRADSEKHEETLQASAYADFLRAMASSAHARDPQQIAEARRDAADAKARIAIYGRRSVVDAAARFEECGATVADEPGRTAFVALVMRMRAKREAVAANDVELLLLGERGRT